MADTIDELIEELQSLSDQGFGDYSPRLQSGTGGSTTSVSCSVDEDEEVVDIL